MFLLLQNSLILAVVGTIASLALGFAMALWLLRFRNPAWGLALVAISFCLPPFLVITSWLNLFGNAGPWKDWLPFPLASVWGASLILTCMHWPVATLLAFVSFRNIPPAWLEAEPGMQGRWLVQKVLWPAARPYLFMAGLIIFTLIFNQFSIPSILQVKVFPYAMWLGFNTTFEFKEAFLLSLPMMALPVLAYVFGKKWLSRKIALGWSEVPAPLHERLGGGCKAVTTLSACVVLGLSLVMPLSQLTFASLTWESVVPAFQAGKMALWNSVLVSAGAGLICLVAGWSLRNWRGGFVLWFFFFLPGVWTGMMLIALLNRPATAWLYQGLGIVWIGFLLRYAAVGWAGVRLAIATLPPAWQDLIRLEGLKGWHFWKRIGWPVLGKTLFSLGALLFLLVLWDVETMLLIYPPGRETLGIRIFNLLHYGHNAQVNALAMLLLAVAILPWLAAALWRRPRAVGICLALVALGSGCRQEPGTVVKSRQTSAPEKVVPSSLFERVETFGSRGTGLGQFNKPRSIVVDREDNVYVADFTGRVQKFSNGGEFLGFWQMPQTDKGRPKGMAVDEKGRVIVIEPHYARINHFLTSGKLDLQWGKYGTNTTFLDLPREAVVKKNGEFVVCEFGEVDSSHRLQRFTVDGKTWLGAFGKMGTGQGEFNRPEGLALDARENIYVADSCNNRIQVFGPTGTFMKMFGQAGTGLGDLSYPYDVAVDSQGLLFVCEFGNSRVQVFNAQGQSVETIGSAGGLVGEFNNPWSLALDSKDNLFVADSMNHRVQKFLRKRT